MANVCKAHQYTAGGGATVKCTLEGGRCIEQASSPPQGSPPPGSPTPPAPSCTASDAQSCNAIEGCMYRENSCVPVNDSNCGFWNNDGDRCVRESNNKCAYCGGVCKAAASCTGSPGTQPGTQVAVAGLCPAKFSDCGTTPSALAACKDFGGPFNLDANEQDKLDYAMIIKERPVSTSFDPIEVCKWYGDEEVKKRARLLKNELRYLISSSNPWSHAGDWGQGAVDSYSKWAKEVMGAYKKVCEFLSKGGCSGQSAQSLTTAIDTIYMYLKECGIESDRHPDYPRQLAHCARKAFSSEYECDKKGGTFVSELKMVQRSCRSATAKNCSDSGSLIRLVISLLKSATGIDISAVCN